MKTESLTAPKDSIKVLGPGNGLVIKKSGELIIKSIIKPLQKKGTFHLKEYKNSE